MKKYALLLPILLSGCVNTINEGLDDLASLSDVVSGENHLTTEELNEIDTFMIQSATTNDVKQAIIEARDNIKAVIDIEACSMNASQIKKYAVPGSLFSSTALQKMTWKYHDENVCLKVVRVHGWEMLAKNAMKFEVVYESEMSGNVTSERYQMIKQVSGEWLFK